MIYGIGTDIVRVARMQQSLDKHGERIHGRPLPSISFLSILDKQFKYLAQRVVSILLGNFRMNGAQAIRTR